MIEMLRSEETSNTMNLMFRWKDMNIYVDGMSSQDGKKYLLLIMGNAGTVGLTLDGNTARWIIYGADLQKSDAFVCTTSSGSALNATGKNTEG